MRQTDAAKTHGAIPQTPILYATQLLGLALGLSPRELGIEALITSADALLAGAGAAVARKER